MSTDIKLSKAQIINKLIKEGRALGSILARFLPKLIKPAISMGKNILAPLGLSAAMSPTDAAIQKKVHGYGTKTVKFSNKDLDDMTKIVKALEDSDVLMKGITERRCFVFNANVTWYFGCIFIDWKRHVQIW